MNTDIAFLASLVESEILRDPGLADLGDSALLEACFRVAAYTVPLPADTDSLGPPGDFLALAVQVARAALANIVANRDVQPTDPGIDEAIVDLVCPPDADAPLQMPRSAQVIGETEWSWSPHHSRWDRWYLSKSTSHRAWVLWLYTPDWRDWGMDQGDCAVAMLASRGVERTTAAIHTLVAYLRKEALGSDLECFHSVTPYGVLSMDNLDCIARAVWGRDSETVAEPLIDMNEMNRTIIRAWRSRVASLDRLGRKGGRTLPEDGGEQ